MNAKSNHIRQKLARELAQLNAEAAKAGANVTLVARVQESVARLVQTSGGNEAGIRRVLEEQYESGALRKETYQLVKALLDRFVKEQIPTRPAAGFEASAPGPALMSPEDEDIFASTTVISRNETVPPTPVEQIQVGSILRDRFMLQKKISGGSMGVVYKALDRRLAEAGELEQSVAIKVVSPALARNAHAFRALQQEAAKGRNLAHPNIVRFIDFDRDDDLYFLVMEWLPGRTLAEILDSPGTKKMPIDEALEIVRQVGKALDYAHRCGIVHADVKPGNIMILPDGTVKLFDFGVARVLQEAEAGDREFDPGVLGAMTPAYSSMQVITGETPVPADDVFSLACLLYRLIAGYRVFGPRNAAEACKEGMQPQALSGLSPKQWDAVRKALSYARVTRFDSVREFLEALNATSIEKIRAEPRGNVHAKEKTDYGKWFVGLGVMLVLGAFAAYEMGYLDQWLPEDLLTLPSAVELPADDSAIATVPDTAPKIDDAIPAEPADAMSPEPVAPSRDAIVANQDQVPVEPAPAAPTNVDMDPPPAAGADQGAALEPASSPPLSPADVEIPLDRSGIDQAIVVRLRENTAPVSVDLVRLGSLSTDLRVRLEEVDYTGNRSPFRTGQYVASGNGTIVFPPGQERARFELSMAPDPLREADQQSTLKVRAIDGDASPLAHIEVELEDDDQRAFETGLGPDTVGFAVSQMSVGERDPAVQVDVVRYNPGEEPLFVEYVVSGITAVEGEDYFSPGIFEVRFAPGQRFARLLIPLVQDVRYEGDEAFVIELVSDGSEVPEGVYRRIAIMIRDDDPPPAT